MSLTYDNALRPATYEADSAANSTKLHEANYAYSKDGMLSSLDNQADAKFDQGNKYDFAGRLKSNEVGTTGVAIPFTQTLAYDAFDNLTSRTTATYGLTPVTFSATYANDRKTLGGSSDTYDAAGNVVSSYQGSPTDEFAWRFDVAGRQARWEEFGPYGNTQKKGGETSFDGDGRAVKIDGLTKTSFGGVWGSWNSSPEYFIYSSVTGQKVTTLLASGAHNRTHIYLGSARIADELKGGLSFNVTDPLSGSTRETDEDGATFPGDESETRNELGGMNTGVPHNQAITMPPPNYARGGYVGAAEGNCIEQDTQLPIPCDLFASLENHKGKNHPPTKERAPEDPQPIQDIISGGLGADNQPMSDETPGLRLQRDRRGPIVKGDFRYSWVSARLARPSFAETESLETKRPRAKWDIEKFRKCLRDLFKTELGLDDGRTKAFDSNGFSAFFGSNRTPFSVTFDHSRSKEGIEGAIGKRALGYAAGDFSPVVYIASDLSVWDDLATRVHEVGNKIFASKMSTIGLPQPVASIRLNEALGKIHADLVDGDAGMALEECVFGGRVQGNGTVIIGAR